MGGRYKKLVSRKNKYKVLIIMYYINNKNINLCQIKKIVHILHKNQYKAPYNAYLTISNIGCNIMYISSYQYSQISIKQLYPSTFILKDSSSNYSFCIYVPKWINNIRNNMDITYYLGYLILYCLKDNNFYIPFDIINVNHVIDYNTNLFVGEFLMPEKEIIDLLYEEGDINIQKLSQHFNVTKDMIMHRIHTLNI